MVDKIDVHDLPEKWVKLIQEFVDFLREKRKKEQIEKGSKEEKIAFATWPSGVKGKLTRKEIYDYL